MRIWLFVLCLAAAVTVKGDSVDWTETSDRLELTISFEPYQLEQLLMGIRPRTGSFVPVGKPGEPALYAFHSRIAVPSGSSVSCTVMKRKSTDEEARIPLFEGGDSVSQLTDPYPSEFVRVSKIRTFRLVSYVDLLVFPLQVYSQKGTVEITESCTVSLKFLDGKTGPVVDKPPYERLYDRLFLNSWHQKGSYQRELSPQTQVWQPPDHTGDVYKIEVETTGVYILDYAFIDGQTSWNMGTLDPTMLRLFYRGTEVPLFISGESDHSFDSGDFVIFYGEALTGEEESGVWCHGDFTDRNVYWLMIGTQAGVRMTEFNARPRFGWTTPSYFSSTVRFEENYTMAPFQTQADIDLWFWLYALWFNTDSSQALQTHTVTLPSVASYNSYPCNLRFFVKGSTYNAAVNPDHHVQFGVNGYNVGDLYLNDYDTVQEDNTFSQWMLGGTGDISVNVTHQVTDPALMGIYSDGVHSDWFEITYARSFEAYNDVLEFHYDSGNYRFDISGFSSDEIILLDISDPLDPDYLEGSISSGIISFEKSIPTGGEDYIAAIPIPVDPADFILDQASSLPLLPADTNWVLIAPEPWSNLAQALSLESLRQSQGLNTAIVSLTDIYDEFNHGIESPHAIRDFVDYLYNQSYPPELQYVVLLGDATYDYKDYMGKFSGDEMDYLVPTLMVADPGLATADTHPYAMHSFDNYYGCLAGDDAIPEVFIGRLPVRKALDPSPADQNAIDILTKVIAYDSITDTSWLGDMAFSTDCTDGSYFEPVQDTNATYVRPQPPHSVTTLYFRDSLWNPAPGDCSAALTDAYGYIGGVIDFTPNGIADTVDEFNEGRPVFSWVGHGGFTIWGSKKYLELDDLSDLTNTDRPSVVLNANCYTGSFYHPVAHPSMLEALIGGRDGPTLTMSADRGMVAGFGPGTYMFIYQADEVTEPFYRAAFGKDKERGIGPLFMNLYLEIDALGERRFTEGMVSFGDPATHLAVPAALAPSNFMVSDSGCRMVELSWDPPGGGFTGTYNLFRSESPDGPWDLVTQPPITETTYQDTDLVYGDTYYYYVAGVDSDGFEGVGSEVVSHYATPCDPTAPSVFSCLDPGWKERLRYSWDFVSEPEISNYRVYYGTSPGVYGSFVDVGLVNTYYLDELTDGQVYYAALSAWNSFGLESPLAGEVVCSPSGTERWNAPDMVFPLQGAENGAGDPEWFWNLPTTDIWGETVSILQCSVYRSEEPDFSPDRSSGSPDRLDYVQAAACVSGTCTYEDSGSPSTAYYYVTCETSEGEESSVSRPPPDYPRGFKINLQNNLYRLSWNPVDVDILENPTGVSLYFIYRGSVEGFTPDVKDGLDRVGSTSSTFFPNQPNPPGDYVYKVMAVDDKGNSGPF